MDTYCDQVSFTQSDEKWICRVTDTAQYICQIDRYGPSKQYYANFSIEGVHSKLRLSEISDFLGQLNGQESPAEPEADDAEQITEALATTDARV